MAYVNRNGQVVTGPAPALGLRSILALITGIINFILYFFKTILYPNAAKDYGSGYSRRGGGGGGGPPRGPRISGMSNLRDASGAAACGAGG